MTQQALSHLKVLELCNFVCGPYCTKLLADLGAEVIKIEPPGIGDEARRRGPFLGDIPHSERSGLYLYLNTNKLGITLDVNTKAGKDILRELIRQTDIFVEDNPPAVMEELGLTYKDLKDINPRLIMTSITPFGQTGPYRDYKAYELNSWHAGGDGYLLAPQSTDPNREPVKGGGLTGDCICGVSASMATLAAAYWMEATGAGQYIDISKHDVLITMDRGELAVVANKGIASSQTRGARGIPHAMRSRDGYILIMAGQPGQWQNVIQHLGNPAWAQGEKFSQWVRGEPDDDEISTRVKDEVEQHDKGELFRKLQDDGIIAAPINTAEDVLNCPQINGRGFFADIDHPEAGKLKYPTAGYKLSQTPWKAERAAPLMGQHNEFVYCDRLGYDKQDLVRMKESQII
jgi:crotonobetainyl-CoA:carnitine CoA-transferase CaiB-like acyl-CoA transferase